MKKQTKFSFLKKNAISIFIGTMALTTFHFSPPSYASTKPSIQPNLELATSYFQAGRFDIALEEIQKAISKDSNSSEAYTIYGSILLRSNELEKAKEALDKALKINNQNADALNNLGLISCAENKTQEALAFYAKALAIPKYPRSAETLINAAVCLQNSNDYLASEKYLIKALELKPFFPVALYHLSVAYLKQNKLDLAMSRVEAIHKQIPPNASTMALQGTIAQIKGENDNAKQFFEKIVRLFPQSPEAKKIIAGEPLY